LDRTGLNDPPKDWPAANFRRRSDCCGAAIAAEFSVPAAVDVALPP